ncbi:hypothetical protein TNCV_1662901 [Trichonephila clavipes]|nr:hypothetical protein TNCV_1662901 [Trichonephila clavipes]
MDVCKCIVSSRHVCKINSRRVESPLVRLEEREERWKTLPQDVLPQTCGGTEPTCTVICMVLNANDKRTLLPFATINFADLDSMFLSISSYTALTSVFYTVYQGSSTNTCSKALLKSSTVAKTGLPVAIERPRMPYTCSTRSRSGDIAGHSNP